jgi:hypothetical protein
MQPANLCHQEKCIVEIAKSDKLSGTFVLAVLPGVSIESIAFDFGTDSPPMQTSVRFQSSFQFCEDM